MDAFCADECKFGQGNSTDFRFPEERGREYGPKSMKRRGYLDSRVAFRKKGKAPKTFQNLSFPFISLAGENVPVHLGSRTNGAPCS